MSSINSVGGLSPLPQTQNLTSKTTNGSSTPAGKPTLSDRLELSGATQFLQALKTTDVRTDKVAAVKAQIANGTYDADGSKLDSATDKLLDEISK
jgi:flagellar biosynthesis anti-sigma factor FlgM